MGSQSRSSCLGFLLLSCFVWLARLDGRSCWSGFLRVVPGRATSRVARSMLLRSRRCFSRPDVREQFAWIAAGLLVPPKGWASLSQWLRSLSRMTHW
jgi:hypothetical protein